MRLPAPVDTCADFANDFVSFIHREDAEAQPAFLQHIFVLSARDNARVKDVSWEVVSPCALRLASLSRYMHALEKQQLPAVALAESFWSLWKG